MSDILQFMKSGRINANHSQTILVVKKPELDIPCRKNAVFNVWKV